MKKIMMSLLALTLLLSSVSYAKATEQHRNETKHHHATQLTGKVDINSADATTLESLKGVGPSKAKAIVAYREKNGSFRSVNDLSKVKGIGEKSIARLEQKNPGRMTVNSNG